MPVIFHSVSAVWSELPISAPCGVLRLGPVGYEPEDPERPAPDGVVLVRIGADRDWAALAPDGTRVFHNGQPLTGGLRILAHRDSLAVPGASPVFFSTEDPARIEPYAGPAEVTCPRCRSEIQPGEPAVKCPGCGVFHHQLENRNCWTYASTCTLCAQPSALDAGFQWTPETL